MPGPDPAPPPTVPGDPRRPRRRLPAVLLHLGLAALLLTLVGRDVDWGLMLALFGSLHAGWVLGSVAGILLVRVLMALRWQYVLRSEGIDEPLEALTQIIFVSHFIGRLLPGSLGIEAVRGYEIVRDHGRAASVAATLLIDRVVGVCAMLVMALGGALLARLAGVPTGLLPHVVVLTALALCGWAVLVLCGPGLTAWQPFPRGRPRRLWSKGIVVVAALIDVPRLRRILLPMLGLSMVVQLLRCAGFYSLYRALGTHAPFASFLLFVPLMFVALMLPISIGGLGLREGLLAYFFGTVGVAIEVSVGVGMLFYVLQIALSVPSMIAWASQRRLRDPRVQGLLDVEPRAVI